MRPRILIQSISMMLLTFIGILIFWLIQKPQPSQFPEKPIAVNTDNLYADLFIPPFRLTDSNNQIVSESILDGQYTLVDFFYTSCPLICPGMSAAMRNVQDQTKDTNLRLLSISIDPDVDTPEIIKRYADAFKADPARWRFTTGDAEMISIILAGVAFDLGALNQDDGFRNINHPSTLLLIGPDLHVIKLYRYTDSDQMEELIKTAHDLAG